MFIREFVSFCQFFPSLLSYLLCFLAETFWILCFLFRRSWRKGVWGWWRGEWWRGRGVVVQVLSWPMCLFYVIQKAQPCNTRYWSLTGLLQKLQPWHFNNRGVGWGLLTTSRQNIFFKLWNFRNSLPCTRPSHRLEAGGVLPYMSYIGMCCTLGYGFRAVLVWNRVWFLPF